jgi:hypothetical protein
MAKENNGKAARRRTAKRLLALCGCSLVLVITLMGFRGNSGNNINNGSVQFGFPMNGQMPRRLGGPGHRRHRSSHQQKHPTEPFDESGMDPHDVAVRFRQDLYDQFESKDEIALLEDVLEARIHLVEIMGLEEEVVRSPKNSYHGVYGSFCRLNFAVHKENPSSGKLEYDDNTMLLPFFRLHFPSLTRACHSSMQYPCFGILLGIRIVPILSLWTSKRWRIWHESVINRSRKVTLNWYQRS